MNSLASVGRGGDLLFGICLLALSACAPTSEPEQSQESEYRLILNMAELMSDVIDPAADVIWDSAGYDIRIDGEKNLAPTTTDGWAHVANSAAVIMESANLLMLPGRDLPGGWSEMASGMADAGMAAKVAAQNRDDAALFEAGGAIYRVCVSCHQEYWVQEL